MSACRRPWKVIGALALVSSIAGCVGSQATDEELPSLEWVRIPSGSYVMGCTTGDPDCQAWEHPAHRVDVSTFWIAATETTNAQYRACVEAGECASVDSEGAAAHPVVRVAWQEAARFCAWADGRLPTEAEWEYAARGGRNDLRYPSGNDIDHDDANLNFRGGRDTWDGTSPAKSFPANTYGLYDVAGNVWEWVEDVWHDSYAGAPVNGSAWYAGGDPSRRVARGGAWFCYPWGVRLSSRCGIVAGGRLGGLGFRCARSDLP